VIKSTYESARVVPGGLQHRIVVQGDVPTTSKPPHQRRLATLARAGTITTGASMRAAFT